MKWLQCEVWIFIEGEHKKKINSIKIIISYILFIYLYFEKVLLLLLKNNVKFFHIFLFGLYHLFFMLTFEKKNPFKLQYIYKKCNLRWQFLIIKEAKFNYINDFILILNLRWSIVHHMFVLISPLNSWLAEYCFSNWYGKSWKRKHPKF